MKKLSSTQLRALWAMPFTMTFWGGEPFTSWPVPGMTIRTIEALVFGDLVTCTYAGNRTTYALTPAGLAARADQASPPALGKPGEP